MNEALVQALRLRAVTTAAELTAALGISQPTLSRRLRDAGDRVLQIGRARATRYALTRDVGRAGSRWPLFRINTEGRAESLGELRALQQEQFHFQPEGQRPALLTPPFQDGLFPGQPWFFDDLRPQGFLGRAFAQRVAGGINANPDINLWSADDVLLALLRHGSDLPGDLVLGEDMLTTAQRELLNPRDALLPEQREQRYASLADAALRGEAPGSSAGGEQPKFTATLKVSDEWLSVIVKFSDRVNTPGGRRWADLLRCEWHASRCLREAGFVAAQSELLQADGRVFLQSMRFDRTPQLGRSGSLSLSALDSAFYGHARIDWPHFAGPLHADGWVNADDARAMRVIGWFGALIGNSDMHLGNLSLRLGDERPFQLAPVYDMLPMRFRPSVGGEVVERDLPLALPAPDQASDWRRAADIAAVFWQAVEADPDIDASLRNVAADATRQIRQARERI